MGVTRVHDDIINKDDVIMHSWHENWLFYTVRFSWDIIWIVTADFVAVDYQFELSKLA